VVDDATAVATTKALLPIVSPATGNDGKHPLSPATTINVPVEHLIYQL
jgi:hypothetical protein